jgi:hypothetical protein
MDLSQPLKNRGTTPIPGQRVHDIQKIFVFDGYGNRLLEMNYSSVSNASLKKSKPIWICTDQVLTH